LTLKKIVQKIPFLRILIALVIGIYVGSIIDTGYWLSWLLSFVLLSLLIFLRSYYNYYFAPLFGVLLTLIFIITGITIYEFYNRKPVFYSEGVYCAVVKEIPRVRENFCQTLLQAEAFYSGDSVFRTNEKIMAWFENSEEAGCLVPGEKMYFQKAPQFISNYKNPFEFDYKRYLNRRKIYRQVYLKSNKWIKCDEEISLTPFEFAQRFRMKFLRVYKDANLGDRECHILSALTLGYKRELEPETKSIFASAGAMHVLAVSGLHVGIIFMMIAYCFGFMKKNKAGRYVFLILVICVLWIYTLITGLSPSVCRASLMFSLVALGNNLKRYSNIYNTLAASAFFLLLINPNNLFDVGFQLSFLAVFGIVFLQPRFEKLIDCKFRPIKYLLGIITVSVAVQLTTFPISIYYFNQFPLYFWVSGLFIIPLVTIIIPLGFLLLIFNGIPLFYRLLSLAADYIINLIVSLLETIEKLPLSTINIALSTSQLLIITGIILSSFFYIHTRLKIYIKSTLALLLLSLIISLTVKINNLSRHEIIVYNTDKLIVHLISGNRNYIISEEELQEGGYLQDIVKNTVINLRLDKPYYLIMDDEFEDEYIFFKNNICLFEGKIFHIGIAEQIVSDVIKPEIVIGNYYNSHFSASQGFVRLFITNQKKMTNSLQEGMEVHYLQEKGAYVEKW